MKKFSIFFIVTWILLSGWCLADVPADQQIKNTMADIARYEKQFAGKSSVNPSNIKQTLKLLKSRISAQIVE